MNPEQRARHVERAAIRAAQQAIAKTGAPPPDRQALLALRIQSVEPWKRILLLVLGLGTAAGGGLLAWNSHPIAGGFLVLLGLGLSVAGILGRRRSVEACLDALQPDLAELVLNVIASALD